MSDSTDDADGTAVASSGLPTALMVQRPLCDTPDNPDGADASDSDATGPGAYVNPFDIDFTSAAGGLVASCMRCWMSCRWWI